MLTGTSFPSRQVRPINHNWVTPESLPMVAFLQNGLGQILADSTSFSTLWTKYLSFDSIRPNHRIQSTAEDMTMRKCSYSWNMWQVWNGKKKLHSANVPHTKNEANCHLDYPVTQNCSFFFFKSWRGFCTTKMFLFSISVYWRLIVIQALSHAFLHHHFLQPCNTVQVVSNSA